MESVWLWLVDQMTTNDVFAGLVGLSLAGSTVFLLRGVLGKLLLLVERQLTVSLVIYNTDEQYHWISAWLSEHPYARRSRRLQLTCNPVEEDAAERGNLVCGLVPGPGRHVLFHGGRVILLTSDVDEEGSKGGFLRQSYRLQMLGRSQVVLKSIVEEAACVVRNSDMTPIYVWTDNCYWAESTRRRFRSPDSVILPRGKMESLLEDANRFFESHQWYGERGVPWRRGYMLHGPPGTGKTSLVMALAGHLHKPLYTISLSGKASDSSVLEAFRTVARNSILLIEDVDGVRSSRDRTSDAESGKGAEKLTLSGLLNAIDGVSSSEGRLLIMTTNSPEVLDPALVRSGRVDRWEKLGLSGVDEAVRMFERFFPDRPGVEDFLKDLTFPLSPADVQTRLLELSNR